jgi:hypothetical protein
VRLKPFRAWEEIVREEQQKLVFRHACGNVPRTGARRIGCIEEADVEPIESPMIPRTAPFACDYDFGVVCGNHLTQEVVGELVDGGPPMNLLD